MSPIVLGYIGFTLNPGFPKTDIITRFFKDGDRVCTEFSEINVLVMGDFITIEEMNVINSYRGIKILYVAEPIINLYVCEFAKTIFETRKCTAVLGCVSNRADGTNWVKYPLYRYSTNITPTLFEETNAYVRNANIRDKQFCTLINRHDWGNTRTPIYELMKQMGEIVCPGKLHNNCSNEELNAIGNVEYIKKFLFNICSENFGADHPGYVTEKIMNACLGGAIPIYYGELDAIDEKIFNRERIIFINEETEGAMKKVESLCMNEDELIKHYRQPVFCEGAYEEIMAMDANAMGFFDTLREYLRRT